MLGYIFEDYYKKKGTRTSAPAADKRHGLPRQRECRVRYTFVHTPRLISRLCLQLTQCFTNRDRHTGNNLT